MWIFDSILQNNFSQIKKFIFKKNFVVFFSKSVIKKIKPKTVENQFEN